MRHCLLDVCWRPRKALRAAAIVDLAPILFCRQSILAIRIASVIITSVHHQLLGLKTLNPFYYLPTLEQPIAFKNYSEASYQAGSWASSRCATTRFTYPPAAARTNSGSGAIILVETTTKLCQDVQSQTLRNVLRILKPTSGITVSTSPITERGFSRPS